MIITLAHTKGGVTKSSIAINLAVWLHDQGHRVAAIDLDAGRFGNQTLTTVLRRAEPAIAVHYTEDANELVPLVLRLNDSFDFVIADAPGGFQQSAETNRRLLEQTDYVLIPIKPDFDDIEPLSAIEQVVAEARRRNSQLQSRILLNCLDGRTHAAKNIDATWETLQAVAPSLGLLRQPVRIDRHGFQSARARGTVVVRQPRSAAHVDLHRLFAALLSDVVATHQRRATDKQAELTADHKEGDREVEAITR